MKSIEKKNFSFFTKDPYIIFEIENFLDLETFDKLKKSFPPEINFPESLTPGGKEIFGLDNPNYQIFLDKNFEWKNFIKRFSDKSIIEQYYKFTLKEHIKNRGLKFIKKWTSNNLSYFKKFFYRKVFFTNYFSLQKKQHVVYPHTDARTKLISLVYYISGNEDGGTEFWNVKNNINRWKNWNNKHLKDSKEISDFKADSILIRKTKFVENKLVGFVKTDLSWHSVLDVGKIDGNKSRKTINCFYRY